MAELLANSPVPGRREPIGELSAELAIGASGAKAMKLLATIAKDTGLRAAGEARVIIDSEIIRFKCEAGTPTEYEVLSRAAEESVETSHTAGTKVYCEPTVGSLTAALAGTTYTGKAPIKVTGSEIELEAKGVTETHLAAALLGPAANVFGLRKVGEGALEACAGNDARLTNERVPTALSVTEPKLAAAVLGPAANVFGLRKLGTGELEALAGNTKLSGFAGKLSELAAGFHKHSELEGLTEGDPHTQYAKLEGRSLSQTFYGAETKAQAEAHSLVIGAWPGSAGMSLGTSATVFSGVNVRVESEFISTGGAKFEGSVVIAFGRLSAKAYKISEVFSPAIIKTNRKDYGGLKAEDKSWNRIEAEKELSIFGIESSGVTESILWLTNPGTFTMKLVSESGECATEADRFKFATTEIVLEPNKTIMLAHDPTTNRWRNVTDPVPTIGEGLELTSAYGLKVKALGITAGMLGAESVEEAKIKNLAVTSAKLAEAIEIAKTLKVKEGLTVEGTTTAKAIEGTSGVFSTTLKVKEATTMEGELKGKAAEHTSGVFTTTLKVKELLTAEGEVKVEKVLKVKETLTAEGAATVAKTLKVTELTTTIGGLTVEGTLTLPSESVIAGAIKKEAIETAKIKLLAVTEGTIAEEAVTGKKLKVGTPEAIKELKENTSIEPSATASGTVYLSILCKVEKTAFEVIADGVAIYKFREELLAASSDNVLCSFRLKAKAKFEVKTTVGKIETSTTTKSVYSFQEG